jgi:hypothetical protein
MLDGLFAGFSAALAPWKWALAGGAVAALIAGAGLLYLKGRSDGMAESEISAAREALSRINRLETNNENFKALDDRGRCLVFMRDSGLPAETCD